ncbi:S8 family serine peptidase [Solwaraspora sp. WMMB335]|uniref:S8 family serine peptidase n=1 Tax=Solwaraspora sp. WMMB335 TaxID=3404118 RepID=UPI003B929403
MSTRGVVVWGSCLALIGAPAVAVTDVVGPGPAAAVAAVGVELPPDWYGRPGDGGYPHRPGWPGQPGDRPVTPSPGAEDPTAEDPDPTAADPAEGSVAADDPGAPLPGCPTPEPATATGSDWAQHRLAVDRAWSRTRGAGVTVALVDSGVDVGGSPLADRIGSGVDVAGGGSGGDLDCLGTGTAMAHLIGAPADAGVPPGVAPEVDILPLRVVTTGTTARPADQVTAIQVAVAAGTTVIALGSYVETDDPAVVAAIRAAADADVVVVAGAPTTQPTVANRLFSPVLRVAGVAEDGTLVATHPPNTVDVAAPGAGVRSLDTAGDPREVTGTQYAVALVAGAVALVRAAHPDLTAAQVVQRIKTTADPLGGPAPDSRYGWGLVDPPAAVGAPGSGIAPATRDIRSAGTGSGTLPQLLMLGVIGLLALVALVGRRLWAVVPVRRPRARGGRAHRPAQEPR